MSGTSRRRSRKQTSRTPHSMAASNRALDEMAPSQALWRARDGISDTLKVARLFAEMAAISGKSRWPVSWEARAQCRGKRGMVAPPISETAPRRFLRTEIMTVLLT